MKPYKIYYTKESGLTQIGDFQAYSCVLKDGIFCFYADEASKVADEAFKYINKNIVNYIGD